MSDVQDCVTLSQIYVDQNVLHATLENGDKVFILDRPLEQHEIVRHEQSSVLSYYFLIQAILIQFEERHFRIESMLVTAPVTNGTSLHFVLFLKDWSVGGSKFDTPLTRITIKRPHQLPHRNLVQRG
jgi:hypothetical protein